MAQAAKAQEPTMEEILASIRKIIADDDSKPKAETEPPKPAPAPAPPAAAAAEPAGAMGQDEIDAMLAGMDAPAEPEPDVLELTEAMEEPAAPAFKTIEATSDIDFAEAEPEPPPPPPPPPLPPKQASPPPVRAAAPPAPALEEPAAPALLSPGTAAAVDAAFHSLANTILVQNATTLEDLVKEMLRPLLKGWLDDNLPTLVERLVRAEIERVSRGGR